MHECTSLTTNTVKEYTIKDQKGKRLPYKRHRLIENRSRPDSQERLVKYNEAALVDVRPSNAAHSKTCKRFSQTLLRDVESFDPALVFGKQKLE